MTIGMDGASAPTGDSDPEGSIFLPETARDLEKLRLQLLLGRGVGAAMTLEEKIAYDTALRTQLSIIEK